jgi:hypothetical protein
VIRPISSFKPLVIIINIFSNPDISDSNGITPAHLAAREGHVECLQTLVDYTNDISLKDKGGLTPADYAFKAGQTGCGRYLVLVETCFGLSTRVKSLSQSLAHCRHENEELRNRIQVCYFVTLSVAQIIPRKQVISVISTFCFTG